MANKYFKLLILSGAMFFYGGIVLAQSYNSDSPELNPAQPLTPTITKIDPPHVYDGLPLTADIKNDHVEFFDSSKTSLSVYQGDTNYVATINGENFQRNAWVEYDMGQGQGDRYKLPTLWKSDKLLEVNLTRINAALIMPLRLFVVNPGRLGNNAVSNSAFVGVSQPKPSINSVSPSFISTKPWAFNRKIIIKGSGFTSASRIEVRLKKRGPLGLDDKGEPIFYIPPLDNPSACTGRSELVINPAFVDPNTLEFYFNVNFALAQQDNIFFDDYKIYVVNDATTQGGGVSAPKNLTVYYQFHYSQDTAMDSRPVSDADLAWQRKGSSKKIKILGNSGTISLPGYSQPLPFTDNSEIGVSIPGGGDLMRLDSDGSVSSSVDIGSISGWVPYGAESKVKICSNPPCQEGVYTVSGQIARLRKSGVGEKGEDLKQKIIDENGKEKEVPYFSAELFPVSIGSQNIYYKPKLRVDLPSSCPVSQISAPVVSSAVYSTLSYVDVGNSIKNIIQGSGMAQDLYKAVKLFAKINQENLLVRNTELSNFRENNIENFGNNSKFLAQVVGPAIDEDERHARIRIALAKTAEGIAGTLDDASTQVNAVANGLADFLRVPIREDDYFDPLPAGSTLFEMLLSDAPVDEVTKAVEKLVDSVVKDLKSGDPEILSRIKSLLRGTLLEIIYGNFKPNDLCLGVRRLLFTEAKLQLLPTMIDLQNHPGLINSKIYALLGQFLWGLGNEFAIECDRSYKLPNLLARSVENVSGVRAASAEYLNGGVPATEGLLAVPITERAGAIEAVFRFQAFLDKLEDPKDGVYALIAQFADIFKTYKPQMSKVYDGVTSAINVISRGGTEEEIAKKCSELDVQIKFYKNLKIASKGSTKAVQIAEEEISYLEKKKASFGCPGSISNDNKANPQVNPDLFVDKPIDNQQCLDLDKSKKDLADLEYLLKHAQGERVDILRDEFLDEQDRLESIWGAYKGELEFVRQQLAYWKDTNNDWGLPEEADEDLKQLEKYTLGLFNLEAQANQEIRLNGYSDSIIRNIGTEEDIDIRIISPVGDRNGNVIIKSPDTKLRELLTRYEAEMVTMIKYLRYYRARVQAFKDQAEEERMAYIVKLKNQEGNLVDLVNQSQENLDDIHLEYQKVNKYVSQQIPELEEKIPKLKEQIQFIENNKRVVCGASVGKRLDFPDIDLEGILKRLFRGSKVLFEGDGNSDRMKTLLYDEVFQVTRNIVEYRLINLGVMQDYNLLSVNQGASLLDRAITGKSTAKESPKSNESHDDFDRRIEKERQERKQNALAILLQAVYEHYNLASFTNDPVSAVSLEAEVRVEVGLLAQFYDVLKDWYDIKDRWRAELDRATSEYGLSSSLPLFINTGEGLLSAKAKLDEIRKKLYAQIPLIKGFSIKETTLCVVGDMANNVSQLKFVNPVKKGLEPILKYPFMVGIYLGMPQSLSDFSELEKAYKDISDYALKLSTEKLVDDYLLKEVSILANIFNILDGVDEGIAQVNGLAESLKLIYKSKNVSKTFEDMTKLVESLRKSIVEVMAQMKNNPNTPRPIADAAKVAYKARTGKIPIDRWR